MEEDEDEDDDEEETCPFPVQPDCVRGGFPQNCNPQHYQGLEKRKNTNPNKKKLAVGQNHVCEAVVFTAAEAVLVTGAERYLLPQRYFLPQR